MLDEPTLEEQSLATTCTIAKNKTAALKKGLAKQKNLLAARKKDLVARQLEPPEELIILTPPLTRSIKLAHKDVQDISVRR